MGTWNQIEKLKSSVYAQKKNNFLQNIDTSASCKTSVPKTWELRSFPQPMMVHFCVIGNDWPGPGKQASRIPCWSSLMASGNLSKATSLSTVSGS